MEEPISLRKWLNSQKIRVCDFQKQLGISTVQLCGILGFYRRTSVHVAARIEKLTGGAIKAWDLLNDPRFDVEIGLRKNRIKEDKQGILRFKGM